MDHDELQMRAGNCSNPDDTPFSSFRDFVDKQADCIRTKPKKKVREEKKRNRMKNLKLYVWEGVLTSYTDGMMFAFAENVEKARELLLQNSKFIPKEDLAQNPQVITTPYALVFWGGV